MINQLNHQLSILLKNSYQKTFDELLTVQSNYPEINQSIELAKSFSLQDYQNNAFNHLTSTLIHEWEKYQEKVETDQFDMIYFEYHEQSTDFMEALSYGIYDMKNFKLTLDPHYYGYEYLTGYWEAGVGFDLEPFHFNKPIEKSEKYFEITEDPKSGYEKLWNLITVLNKYVLNKVFVDADNQGVFKNLKIKQGGIFMLDIHDGGSVQSPFYFKV